MQHADEGGYDLIVVGHSGHSELWGWLLGDTADRIADHAHGSVLIVKRLIFTTPMLTLDEVMTEPTDSSRPDFWDVRYTGGKTPWDFHGLPATLKSFLKASVPGKVLIPGCGTGYEVQAFHEMGWKVTAIDFSPAAVEQARKYLGALGHFVEQADFFKYGRAESFDLIYERTFLCALPPDIWRAYADRMALLLRLGGRLVGIFFYGGEPEPPPYPLTEFQAQELFGKRFSLLKSISVEDSLPLFIGKERWQEWKRIR